MEHGKVANKLLEHVKVRRGRVEGSGETNIGTISWTKHGIF